MSQTKPTKATPSPASKAEAANNGANAKPQGRPKATRPQFAGQPEPGRIHFTHGEGRLLEFEGGATHLARLLDLGAAFKTREQQGSTAVTQTDAQGLKTLVDTAEGITEQLTHATRTIGKVMALASDQLSPDDVHELGWLICGLGEIASAVEFARSELAYELQRDFGGAEG